MRDPGNLKGHDTLLLLKLVVLADPAVTYEQLGDSLGLSTSEILNSLRRLDNAGLADSDTKACKMNAVKEFLLHAVRFLAPARLGSPVKGLELSTSIRPRNGLDKWVWKDKEASSVGYEITPLHHSVPFAARLDPSLHKLLSLVDLVRLVSDSEIVDRESALSALQTLLDQTEASRSLPPSDDDLLANLADQGAPLVLSKKAAVSKASLSNEKALAWGLVLSRKNPTLARVMPVVFYKQRDQLDFRALRLWARSLAQERTLGFFLELTSQLAKDQGLRKKAKTLKPPRVLTEPAHFFTEHKDNPWRDAVMVERTPEVARKWGFKMNMELDSFASHFRKFAHS